jgi:hypothetical protein
MDLVVAALVVSVRLIEKEINLLCAVGNRATVRLIASTAVHACTAKQGRSKWLCTDHVGLHDGCQYVG